MQARRGGALHYTAAVCVLLTMVPGVDLRGRKQAGVGAVRQQHVKFKSLLPAQRSGSSRTHRQARC